MQRWWPGAEVLEVLLVLVFEQIEGRRLIFVSVEDRAPALFHKFDDAWNVGGECFGSGVSDGTGLSREVAANDVSKLVILHRIFPRLNAH